MAPSIINNDAVQGETFVPGQIFVFGGFVLRANLFGHLEQIESYAPGRQVRFGSLNFTADICGDLIFNGFEPQPSAPHCHDGHDLAPLPDSALEAAHESALNLASEPAVQIEDEWLDTASGAVTSTEIEPNTDFVPSEAHDSKVPDSLPDSEPASNRIRLGADHGVHRCGHLSTLTFRRHPEFTKVSLIIRRALARLWSARMGCER